MSSRPIARPLFAIVLLVMAFAAITAGAAAAPRATTPELIKRAVRSGQIPQDRGHLYRAYAIGRPDKLPKAYRSSAPWEGTTVLLRLRRAVQRMDEGPTKREIESIIEPQAAGSYCGSESVTLPSSTSGDNFYLEYGTIGGGLTAAQYLSSLETSWVKQVDSFRWAAPPVAATPAPESKYHVRVDALGSGLYGYVTTYGTYAGLVGDNPATGWNDGDAYASCMVLNSDFSGFPGTAQQALDATVAHEFHHSIQFGYGALTGANVPDDAFVEGGATWMEDEVFDAADDNHYYLWPNFADGMGEYGGSPYSYWITFRGMTERYGAGVAGGGEDVMQRFWELTSQNAASNLRALDLAVSEEGTTLAAAFHAYSIAAGFSKGCGGGYVLPYCFEEAPAYVARAGIPPIHASIGSVGGSVPRSLEDNYAINWVGLPNTGGQYNVAIESTDAAGGPGSLRGTAVCDTGTALRLDPLPLVAQGGTGAVVFDSAGCVRVLLSVTNETRTADNPTSSTSRNFVVRTSTEPPQTLTVTRDGAGSGRVSSSPGGIDCGSTCTAPFVSGTEVTLTPTPDVGSTFESWSGACTGTGPCQVTMTEARNVTATFERASHALSVAKAGDGSGGILSAPAGIDCGSTCTASFQHGTVVTLSPAANADSTFTGWSGACTGTGACEVTMSEARDVSATFTLRQDSTAPPSEPPPEEPGLPIVPGALTPLPDVTAPLISIKARRLRATRRGQIRLPLACATGETEGCNGTLRIKLLRGKSRTAGKKSFRIAGGTKKRITVRLSPKVRRRLSRSHRVKLRAVVVVTDAAGNARTVRRTLKVRAARR